MHSSSVINTQTNKSHKLKYDNTVQTLTVQQSHTLCDVRTTSSTAILHDAVTVASKQVCTNQQLADVHMLKYKSGRLKCKHRKESLPVL
jgi:hypothetical protein